MSFETDSEFLAAAVHSARHRARDPLGFCIGGKSLLGPLALTMGQGSMVTPPRLRTRRQKRSF